MKFSRLLAGSTLALGLAAAAPALATTVVLDETLDLTAPQTGDGTFAWRGFDAFSPAFGFDLSVGDTLDYTVHFVSGQSLTVNDLSFLWNFSYGDMESDFQSTGTLAFLDSSGSEFLVSNSKTDTEGSVHFGQQFTPDDFDALPSSLTFYGLRYVGTLDSFANPDVTTSHYADPELIINADGGGTINAGVPEPAAWGLMLLGFAGIGAALRSHRGLAAV